MSDTAPVLSSAGAPPVSAARLARASLRLGYEGGLAATAHADLYRFMALSQTSDRAERHEAWRTRR